MCNMTALTRLPAFVSDPAVVSAAAPSKLWATPSTELKETVQARSAPVRRQVSPTAGERFVRLPCGVAFQNEAFRLRTQAKISELEVAAAEASTAASSTNALLAKKALRYRRVTERRVAMEQTVRCS
ncbi:hypothetical protein BBJ28_00024507 [Nothophytophthora sp. Chile5]|nr:hypothetical protein BBJ28_00024507 [Nothophytophthora sp. Chile5]